MFRKYPFFSRFHLMLPNKENYAVAYKKDFEEQTLTKSLQIAYTAPHSCALYTLTFFLIDVSTISFKVLFKQQSI